MLDRILRLHASRRQCELLNFSGIPKENTFHISSPKRSSPKRRRLNGSAELSHSGLYICHIKALVGYGTRCLYENTNFYSVLIVRSAFWLKLKSSHFRKCCEKNFYLCVRLTQNHMEIFSTTAKLFVWRLRLRVRKAQSLHYWRMGGKNLKSLKKTFGGTELEDGVK